MKNYISEGCRIQNIAPVDGIVSGTLHMIGDKPAVAMTSAAEGEVYVSMTEGVFEVPKAVGVIAIGVKVYLDEVAGNVTTTALDNTLVGYAFAPALSADGTVQIYVNCCVLA